MAWLEVVLETSAWWSEGQGTENRNPTVNQWREQAPTKPFTAINWLAGERNLVDWWIPTRNWRDPGKMQKSYSVLDKNKANCAWESNDRAKSNEILVRGERGGKLVRMGAREQWNHWCVDHHAASGWGSSCTERLTWRTFRRCSQIWCANLDASSDHRSRAAHWVRGGQGGGYGRAGTKESGAKVQGS